MKNKVSTITEGLILSSKGLYINPDKINSFKGFQIEYVGDIRISCSWCNKMHEIEKDNLKTGFLMAANNISKTIIIFSINPNPDARIMLIDNLPFGNKLFGIKQYTDEKFRIKKISYVDSLDQLHRVTIKREGQNFKANQSTWNTLVEGSKDWKDIKQEDTPIITKKLSTAKYITGWQVIKKLDTPKSIQRPRVVSNVEINKPVTKKGGY